ncbi:hypothetical protein L9F63_026794, partial [Diploptera punctata]
RNLKTRVKEHLRNKVRRSFTKKVLYKRLPVLSWLPKYNGDDVQLRSCSRNHSGVDSYPTISCLCEHRRTSTT